MAVAFFNTNRVKGEVLFTSTGSGTLIKATFTQLPPGLHGFHIHRAGDLRGKGCLGACEHYHRGPPSDHGGAPGTTQKRHTGDLGNIEVNKEYKFFLKGIPLTDLFGRSVIVHEKEDDLGKGGKDDSLITGASGKRIGCALIGRLACHKNKTQSNKKNKNKNFHNTSSSSSKSFTRSNKRY